MNKAVEKTTRDQIVELSTVLRANPTAVLEIVEDGSGWGLYKKPTPAEALPDDQVDDWMDENCIVSDTDYEMESPDFNFRTDILTEALALAIGIKVEPM